MGKNKGTELSRPQKLKDQPSAPLSESEPDISPPQNKQGNRKTGNREEKGEKKEKPNTGSPEEKKSAKDSSNEKISLKKKIENLINVRIICSIGILFIGIGTCMFWRLSNYDYYGILWTEEFPQIANSASNSQVHPVENFKKEFKDLKSKFTAQDADFWKRIKVPVFRVIRDDEPDYPAIVLLVSKGDSTSKTATCLAKQYRSMISKIYTGEEKLEKGYINVQTISSSVEDFKYMLDKEIKELFNNTKPEVHTIVIDHIEALDPNVMLLFHGYCDGDHAPYKKAMFVFVLHTDLETAKASEDLDKTVDHHLLTLWEKNLDKDKIPPLLARVANNKALIQEEHISSLTKSGC